MAGFWQRIWGTEEPQPSTSGRALTGPIASSEVDYAVFEPRVTHLGAMEWDEYVTGIWHDVRGMSAAELWKTQPHLRTVVAFVARNIASLGVHVYDRVSEDDRKRNRENDFSRAIMAPGDGMTKYRLLFSLVGDKMLYDRAYWLPYTDKAGQPRIRRLPPVIVSPSRRTIFGTEEYVVTGPDGTLRIPAERLIVFGGYNPTSNDGASPVLEALKETLAEQLEATGYRKQVWKRGGRTSAVIQRPLEAPAWDKDSADRFREDWYSNYTGDGPKAGGTPVLEDGMTIQRIDFSANDMQWAEGAKLSQVTVANAYHVNPTMIGILDNANFSNVREFRRMLYGDTLGPYITDLEDTLNAFALSHFGVDAARSYVEFNIFEKMQGSFEEQAAVMSTATGAPYMLRSEARSRLNLPNVPGMDEPVVPLNVLIGGMASPRDTGSQNEDPTGEDPDQERAGSFQRKRIGVKARANPNEEEQVARVVLRFFKRQEAAVRSRLGSKADEDWWDEERWDEELADDLYRVAVMVSESVAAKTLEAIGFEPDAYDVDRTLAWLKEVSARSASSLNTATKAMIADALGAEDVGAELDSVFASQESRATMIAVSTCTLVSGFAATESAKQAVGEDRATKTWHTGTNPRPEHAAVDGETVLLSENFSNGAAWPGDGSALGAEDLSNCNCELEINVVTGGE